MKRERKNEKMKKKRYSVLFLREALNFKDYCVWDNDKRDCCRDGTGNIIAIRSKKSAKALAKMLNEKSGNKKTENSIDSGKETENQENQIETDMVNYYRTKDFL